MTDLRAAIETYHALLDDDLAAESQELLAEQLRRRGLFFGERPLCVVLRPRFLTPAHYAFLRQAMRAILRVFDKAFQAALAAPSIRAQFHLADWEEQLIQVEPGFRSPSPTSRMDTFFVPADGTLKLVEYNAETPAGVAYNDALTEVFSTLPIMQRFEGRYEVRPLPVRHQVLHVLLDAYRQWGGRERPTIAILDWREVPTYSEFVLFRDFFQTHGYPAQIVDPRGVEYRGGALWSADGARLTLVYKRVLLSELVQRGGVDHPVIQAARDGAICLVNSFRSKLLHKKASFAVLSDEANAALFDAADRQAIEVYIPWTRLLADRRTQVDGRQVDLLTYAQDHKDDLVLKPNDEYGGKGVVLGWEVSAEAWQAALRAGLAEPTVIQRRVQQPGEPYPVLADGRLRLSESLFDTDPFLWNSAYASGCLTRISTAALLNVTAGGGSTVPTCVVEER